ncbi:hypothetical protein LPB72_03215 [Hydrogenophaga crassostreae]|uniref:Globin n=1 Tax=Hydrogenophaga crassostreae TaxID=1763535 RepID=A0A167IT77_9BURK|nr:group III truncated hemoglobin [Hydrogenophaga crassostreae]AOW14416.1 hypothetical protein LPB072_17820 [Hydrogenophaga crassostreae]OAD43559.1 hypothetical protein LPB72_03215 [Hydrogenophaga crassostreae]
MHSDLQTTPPANLNRDSITRLVTRFYRDVRADNLLGPTFEGVLAGRWDAHLPRMVAFWSTVMLGTHSYKGNVYAKHMVVPGVTPEHFTRWITLWRQHTSAAFDAASAGRFQHVAMGMASQLYRGHFGQPLNPHHTDTGAQP